MSSKNAISMVDLRSRAEEIIAKVRKGKRMVLTYRGRPVLRLVPLAEEAPEAADPFYRLPEIAEDKGEGLSNEQIDSIVYGS